MRPRPRRARWSTVRSTAAGMLMVVAAAGAVVLVATVLAVLATATITSRG